MNDLLEIGTFCRFVVLRSGNRWWNLLLLLLLSMTCRVFQESCYLFEAGNRGNNSLLFCIMFLSLCWLTLHHFGHIHTINAKV